MVRPALIIVFLSVLALIGCDSALLTMPGPASPSSMPEPRYSGQGNVRLIDMTGQHQPGQRAELGFNITEGFFDRDHDGEIDDRQAFVRAFRARVPDGFTGVVALDWEGTIFKWLSTDPSSANFKRAIENCSELLAIVRAERPSAQYGFYGLPFRQYWKRNTNWRKQAKALAPLLSKTDWIGPSIYHLYQSPEQRPAAENDAYARENIELALEVARLAGGKPVYAWINHRYVPSNQDKANHLVDDVNFRRHLKTILSTSHQGTSVEGIIWWGADSWYHKKNQLPEASGSNPKAHFAQVHAKYLNQIVDALP